MEYLLTSHARRLNGPFLRISLAIILAWIGTLKFVDPSPVVGLLRDFQAYAGLVTVGLFLGTLSVNVIAMAPACESRRVATQAVTA